MRRVMMMLAAMAVMVSLFAGVAYAAEIWGTEEPERLLESDLDDNIFGRQGGDKIFANLYGPDGLIRETDADRDKAYGNRGPDNIYATDGDNEDTLDGGLGHDECFGDDEDVFVDCEEVNGVNNPL